MAGTIGGERCWGVGCKARPARAGKGSRRLPSKHLSPAITAEVYLMLPRNVCHHIQSTAHGE